MSALVGAVRAHSGHGVGVGAVGGHGSVGGDSGHSGVGSHVGGGDVHGLGALEVLSGEGNSHSQNGEESKNLKKTHLLVRYHQIRKIVVNNDETPVRVRYYCVFSHLRSLCSKVSQMS